MKIKRIVTIAGIVVACALPIICAEMIEKKLPNTIQKKNKPEECIETEQNETAMPTALPTEVIKPEGDVLSVENQLYTILQQRKKWQKDWNENMLNMKYAVTDLDQNGRLEIIVTTGPNGNGQYSSNWIYQINEAGTKLKECEYNGWMELDIFNNIKKVLLDNETGIYHYVSSNYTHLSGDQNGESIGLMSLDNGIIHEEVLGYQDIGDTQDNKVVYYQKIGNKKKKISKKEYTLKSLISKKYKDSKIKPVCIHWFTFSKDVKNITDFQLMHEIKESYEAFGIGKKSETPYVYESFSDKYYVPFNEIDWNEYQYQMTEEEYLEIWKFIPALTEGKKININGKKTTLEEYYMAEVPMVYDIYLQDLTGDGNSELILCFSFSDYHQQTVFLTKWKDEFYLYEKLPKSFSVYDSGIVESWDSNKYYRYRMQNGEITKEIVASCDFSREEDGKDKYYIDGKKVSEYDFDKWREELEHARGFYPIREKEHVVNDTEKEKTLSFQKLTRQIHIHPRNWKLGYVH